MSPRQRVDVSAMWPGDRAPYLRQLVARLTATRDAILAEGPDASPQRVAALDRAERTLRRAKGDAHRHSDEVVLSRVGRRLYEAFYRDYTRKQWGRPAAELDPEVCGRIPVRLDRDDMEVAAARLTDAQHRALADALVDPVACGVLADACISRPGIRIAPHA